VTGADGEPDGWLEDRPEEWPVHGTQELYRGRAPFVVRWDELSAPGRDERFSRLVVEHPGAVVVLAVDDEERALVLRQYRHASRTRFVELPAGLLDNPGEDPLEAARRELLEEAAHEAGEWTHLSSLHNSPAITSERIEIYLARGLTAVPDRGGFELEHEEADMTVHRVPVDDLLDAVLDGRLTNGPFVVAVLTYAVLRARGALPSSR
jgi:ADP-ribose pyrophosphatase